MRARVEVEVRTTSCVWGVSRFGPSCPPHLPGRTTLPFLPQGRGQPVGHASDLPSLLCSSCQEQP